MVKSGILLEGGNLQCPQIAPAGRAGRAAPPPGHLSSGPSAAAVTAGRDQECCQIPELGTEGTQLRTQAVEVKVPVMSLTQPWGVHKGRDF